MLLLVDGPDLRLTVPFVLSVVDAALAAPDSESKSERMNPSVPLCLTLDQPFAWFSSTSTLVRADRVLMILSLVDAPALKLTEPVVLRVPIADDVDADATTVVVCAALPSPPRVRKSDLIKPDVPLTLTFDQPAGSCSLTSTLVPAMTVERTFDVVDALDLTLTPEVVRNVAVPLIGNLRKSERIKPVEFPTVTLDQPAGLWSRTSTFVPACNTVTTLASVDGSDLSLTESVVRNVPADADVDGARLSIRHMTIIKKIIFCNLCITMFSP